MQCYLVGGAVRDILLGLPIQDKDYVVVGATPQQMIDAGFQPVGRDFPVFLHPDSHEEYALARSERKVALGYKGFNFYTGPDVTLEQDLMRRDITINAMAQAVDQNKRPYGAIIDPYGGQADIQKKILRHVSPAFVEDPVRILRVARFAARFDTFTIAAETEKLMHAMVCNGEVHALIPERVWRELARGLMEAHPQNMLRALQRCGALEYIFPEFKGLLKNFDNFWLDQDTNSIGNHDIGKMWMRGIQTAAKENADLAIRFAILMFIFRKNEQIASAVFQLKALIHRLRIPKDYADLAYLLLTQYDSLEQACSLSAEQVVTLLQTCDAWRRPTRLYDILTSYTLIRHASRQDLANTAYLKQAYNATLKINNAQIVAACVDQKPETIAAAIRRAKTAAIAQLQ